MRRPSPLEIPSLDQAKKNYEKLLDSITLSGLIHAVWSIRYVQTLGVEGDLVPQGFCLQNIPKLFNHNDPTKVGYINQYELEQLVSAKITRTPVVSGIGYYPTSFDDLIILLDAQSHFNNARYESARLAGLDALRSIEAAQIHHMAPEHTSLSLSKNSANAINLHSGPHTKRFLEKVFSQPFIEIFKNAARVQLLSKAHPFIQLKALERLLPEAEFSSLINYIRIVSNNHAGAHLICKKVRAQDPLSYRAMGILSNSGLYELSEGMFTAPLDAQLMQTLFTNATEGLPGNKDKLRNEISAKFEDYVVGLISHFFPSVSLKLEYNYGSRKHPKLSPDIIIKGKNQIHCIVECKYQSARFDDKFRRSKVDDYGVKAEEVWKGILQIWRYIAHLQATRPLQKVLPTGYVLTKELWTYEGSHFQQDGLAYAHKKANLEGIDQQARADVSFLSVLELERVLPIVGLGQFYRGPYIQRRENLPTVSGAFELMDGRPIRTRKQKAKDYPIFKHETEMMLDAELFGKHVKPLFNLQKHVRPIFTDE